MKCFKLTLAIALGLCFLAGATAEAQTAWTLTTGSGVTERYISGNWNTGGNWSGGVPGDSDVVTLPDQLNSYPDYVVTMDAQPGRARSLTISADATLLIATAKTLEIGDGTDQDSTVNGTVILAVSGSVLKMTESRNIDGSGEIIGQHNLAEITDAASEVLTIGTNLTVRGALKVTMDMVNNGLVWANDGTTIGTRDTLELFSGTPSGSGEWKAVRSMGGNDAFLLFSVSATGLTGDFTVGHANSMLHIEDDVDVCTTGDLTFDGGAIKADPGGSFKAGGACS